MTGWFRTYAPDWTPTGYAREPQYPGQAEIPECSADGCDRPAERRPFPLTNARKCDAGHITLIEEQGE